MIVTNPQVPTTGNRQESVDRILDGVSAIVGHQRCAVARTLHRAGISMAHLQILWILGEHGPAPMSHLADLLGVALPNATGLVDRMEQRGLVARDRAVTDRRVVLVRVTQAGRETVEQVDGWRTAMLDQLLTVFEGDELARIANALDQIRGSFGGPTDSSCGPGASRGGTLEVRTR